MRQTHYDVARKAHNCQANPRHRIQKGQLLTRRKTKATEEKGDYLDRIRGYHASEAYQKVMRKRHGR